MIHDIWAWMIAPDGYNFWRWLLWLLGVVQTWYLAGIYHEMSRKRKAEEQAKIDAQPVSEAVRVIKKDDKQRGRHAGS